MTTKTDHAREQAQAQLEHIRQLMGWLEHANECDGLDDAGGECFWAGNGPLDYLGAPVEPLEVHDTDKATQAILENALSVEVRGPWHLMPAPLDSPTFAYEVPVEFRILLCTGGPAVRIMGELDEHGTPDTAWLEYQDWGTPWTGYDAENAHIVPGPGCCNECSVAYALLRYAQQFYFGG